jgi:hypothetical protein
MVIMLTNNMHHKLLTFGSAKNLDRENEKNSKQYRKRWCCVLLPNNKFSLIWNLIMIFLMLYVLIYVTFDVAFNKQNIDFSKGYLNALMTDIKM